MAKSLEDAKKKLEEMDDGTEFVEAVVNEIEALKAKIDVEKKKGISEVKKRNSEAEGLRKFKLAMEKLGFDSDADDLESFSDELKEKIEDMSDPEKRKKVENSPEYRDVQKQLKLLNKKLETTDTELKDEREKAGELKNRNRRSIMKSTLLGALKGKVYGPDLAAESLINDGKVTIDEDDEKTVLFKEGEDSIDFDDGIAKFLEKRKDIVINDQNPGSGDGGGDGGEKDKDEKAKRDEKDPKKRLAHLRKLKKSSAIA